MQCEVGMKIDAVVYKTTSGFSQKYAEIIAKKIGCNAIDIQNAKMQLKKENKIVYVSSLMAGLIVGVKNAKKNFDVVAIVANGLTPPANVDVGQLKTDNKSEEVPLFYVQGGLDLDKQNGLKKFGLKLVLKMVAKKMAKSKEDLKIAKAKAFESQNYVEEENLNDFYSWLEKA